MKQETLDKANKIKKSIDKMKINVSHLYGCLGDKLRTISINGVVVCENHPIHSEVVGMIRNQLERDVAYAEDVLEAL